jgi:serine protease
MEINIMKIEPISKNYAPKGIKVRCRLSGFILQINSQEEDVQKVIGEILIDLQLIPIGESLNCYSLHQDLLEVFINLMNMDAEEITVVQKAWDAVYRIYEKIPHVIYVEPKFELLVPSDGECPPPCSTDFSNGETKRDERTQNDPEWHLKKMQVTTAWENYFENDPSIAGQDIVIGHPDTGYLLPHPELLKDLGIAERQEIWDDQPLKRSDDNEPKVASPSFWHGLATASIMISPRGPATISRNRRFVSGVVPGATLLPLELRFSDDDFRFYSTSLAKAIDYAAELSDEPNRSGRSRVDIISISLSGYPNLRVRRAIINAIQRGIIVIGAAGNGIPFVGWPSAYDSVIAVASSTIDGNRAIHSARGSRVNIAAPGEGIYCAIVLSNGKYDVQQRDGTSYAAPLVAGVAALWLSHRREEIDSKYSDDPAKIPLAFAKLLNEQFTPWDEDNCGPGIVNADKLLKADLPDPNDLELIVPRVIRYDENLALDQGGVVTFKHLFEATLSHPDVIRQISSRKLSDQQFLKEVGALSIMEWVLGELVGRSGHSLTSFLSLFGRELTFHFGTNFELYNLFVDALHTEKIEESLPAVRQILCDVASKDLREELLKSSQKL